MRGSFLTILFLVPVILTAQDQSERWLSLDRLSVSVTSSYAFVPWREFNDSYQIFHDAVGYNSAYPNPTGYIQKIQGDASIGLQVNYRLFGGLSVFVGGEYGGTKAKMEFKPQDFLMQAYRHEFEFSMTNIGGGIAYEQNATSWLRTTVFFSVETSKGKLNTNYGSNYVTSIRTFSAPLSDRAILFRGGYGLGIDLLDPLSIDLMVEYRSLRYDGLKGRGLYVQQYTTGGYYYEEGFDAILVSGPEYFGAGLAQSSSSYLYQALGLWMADLSSIPSPATLDLSGISIRLALGVRL